MKTFTINRSSWHHKLYNFGTNRYPEDFCQYTRGVLVGMFWALVFTALGISATMAVGDFFAWLAASVFHWQFLDPQLGAGITAFIMIVVAMFVLAGLIMFGIRQVIHRSSEQEPGFIRTAYSSMKNRFCIRVEIQD